MRPNSPAAPGLFAAPLIAAMIAGCASGASTAECAAIDWAASGFQDGLTGASPEAAEEKRAACAARGHAVDLAAYDAAREEGLKSYCTPKGAFAAGKSGGKYFGVCPSGEETEFLASFALGEKLRALTAAKEEAVADYESAIADLDQHKYLLRVAEKRYLKSSISNEDREQERQDAEFRRREIARIEGRIPEMLESVKKAQEALEAFRIELLTSGLEI